MPVLLRLPHHIQRRQDSSVISIVTVTDNEASSALLETLTIESSNSVTTVGSQSSTEHVNSVPEIDGSEGGFVGLVVGLGILVIICCVTVFFLLRHRGGGGNPSRRNRELGNIFPSSVGGAVDSDFPTQERALFGSRAGRHGWTRTADENDDSDGEQDGLGVKLAGIRARSASPTSEVGTSDSRRDHGYGNSPYPYAPHHSRSASSTSSSASTVRLHSAAQPTVDTTLWRSNDSFNDESPKHFSPPHPHGLGGSKFREEII